MMFACIELSKSLGGDKKLCKCGMVGASSEGDNNALDY